MKQTLKNIEDWTEEDMEFFLNKKPSELREILNENWQERKKEKAPEAMVIKMLTGADMNTPDDMAERLVEIIRDEGMLRGEAGHVIAALQIVLSALVLLNGVPRKIIRALEETSINHAVLNPNVCLTLMEVMNCEQAN